MRVVLSEADANPSQCTYEFFLFCYSGHLINLKLALFARFYRNSLKEPDLVLVAM